MTQHPPALVRKAAAFVEGLNALEGKYDASITVGGDPPALTVQFAVAHGDVSFTISEPDADDGGERRIGIA